MGFTDRPLRLITPILGIEPVDGRQTAIMIPVGALVYMAPEPVEADPRFARGLNVADGRIVHDTVAAAVETALTPA